MKKSITGFWVILLLITGISCKKAVEQKQEDILMKAITDGTWIVEQYFENGSNLSYEFLNYDFNFNSNGVVTGTIAGSSTSGTWSGSASTASITSNFPTSTAPLVKMNGIWKITDSYWDYVEAETTVANGKNVLRLRKK